MKDGIAFIFVYILVVFISGCSNSTMQEEMPQSSSFANAIVGEWQKISYLYPQADGSVTRGDTTTYREAKIITPTHFSWLAQTADGEFRHAGLGTHTFDGMNYIETVKYSSNPDWIGVSEYTVEWINPDKFIQRSPGGSEHVFERAK